MCHTKLYIVVCFIYLVNVITVLNISHNGNRDIRNSYPFSLNLIWWMVALHVVPLSNWQFNSDKLFSLSLFMFSCLSCYLCASLKAASLLNISSEGCAHNEIKWTELIINDRIQINFTAWVYLFAWPHDYYRRPPGCWPWRHPLLITKARGVCVCVGGSCILTELLCIVLDVCVVCTLKKYRPMQMWMNVYVQKSDFFFQAVKKISCFFCICLS